MLQESTQGSGKLLIPSKSTCVSLKTRWGRPRDSQRSGGQARRRQGRRLEVGVHGQEGFSSGSRNSRHPTFPAIMVGLPSQGSQQGQEAGGTFVPGPKPHSLPSPGGRPSTFPETTGEASPPTSRSLQARPAATWCPSNPQSSLISQAAGADAAAHCPRAPRCPLRPWPRLQRRGHPGTRARTCPVGAGQTPGSTQGGQTSCQVPSLAVRSAAVAEVPQEAAPRLGRGHSRGRARVWSALSQQRADHVHVVHGPAVQHPACTWPGGTPWSIPAGSLGGGRVGRVHRRVPHLTCAGAQEELPGTDC